MRSLLTHYSLRITVFIPWNPCTQLMNGTELLKRVAQKSIIIIIPVSAVAAFFEWKKLPLGILAGGLFGILNLRGLVRSVEGFLGTAVSTAKILFLNMTRLLILFSALFVLIKFKLINVLGLLFGFTVVFVLILIEGMKMSKSQ
ncbi:MAG: hypothetical protein KAJ59_02675 [Thermodesulfovibrionia bacterium]|nr:hypothetical protein [Thermodesulfovibrionia bacterium]